MRKEKFYLQNKFSLHYRGKWFRNQYAQIYADGAFACFLLYSNYIEINFENKVETIKVNKYNAIDIFFNKIRDKIKDINYKKNYPFLFGYIAYDAYLFFTGQEGKIKTGHSPLIMLTAYNKIEIYNKKNQKIFFNNLKRKQLDKLPEIGYKNKNYNFKSYINAFKKIKYHIYEGDIYQANLTFPKKIKTDKTGKDIFREIYNFQNIEYGAIIKNQNIDIISFSMELFLRRAGEKIYTEPIKGTIETDKKKARAVLKNSKKDLAEHLMIVDLERNDLGRISMPGTVKVNFFYKIKKYTSLYHSVSLIEGRLKQGIKIEDILKATFPGGSVTGAPKLRAIEILTENEKYNRFIYTGALGWIDKDLKNFIFNLPIRTMLKKNNEIYYNAGGGIVYDSDLNKEIKETYTKSKILNIIKNNENF